MFSWFIEGKRWLFFAFIFDCFFKVNNLDNISMYSYSGIDSILDTWLCVSRRQLQQSALYSLLIENEGMEYITTFCLNFLKFDLCLLVIYLMSRFSVGVLIPLLLFMRHNVDKVDYSSSSSLYWYICKVRSSTNGFYRYVG